jgi:hypothetical protein
MIPFIILHWEGRYGSRNKDVEPAGEIISDGLDR